MRLRAWDLTIERGGRRVIAGLSFEAAAGSAPDRDRAERGGENEPARERSPASCRSKPAALRWTAAMASAQSANRRIISATRRGLRPR